MRNIVKSILRWASTSVITRSMNNENIYLTFDDGPHPHNTKELLDVLDKHTRKATFFMVGKQMEMFPETVEKVRMKGHSIGYHSYHHKHATDMGFFSTLKELKHAKKLEHTFNISFNKRYRPPYGELTFPVILAILLSGWKIILWSKDSQDSYINWELSAQEILSSNVSPGEIILLHDDYKDTSNTIDLVLSNYAKNAINTAIL